MLTQKRHNKKDKNYFYKKFFVFDYKDIQK